MMRKLTTSDYCIRVTDGTHDTPKPSNEGYYLITSKHISDSNLNFKDAYRISEKDYLEVNKRSKVEQWDILFSMIGSVGEIYIERDPNPQYAIKNLGLFKMGGDKYKALKLYYFLKSPYFQKKLRFWLSGSIQSFVPLYFLRGIELPDLDSVSNELIDEIEFIQEKISLNLKLISDLDEYSQLLFYKWFIKFNFPDSKGKPYKDSGGAINVVDGTNIPVGWEFVALTEFGKIVSGGTPSTSNEDYFCDNGIPWITPKDLSLTNNKFIERGAIDITEEGLNNSSAKLMPKGTVLMSSRAPIGYLAIAKNEVTTNQGFKSIVPYPNIGSEFIFYTLKRMMPKIEKIASGSTFKEVSKEMLSKLKILKPDDVVVGKFNEKIGTLSLKIMFLEKENELLTETRGLLIKKLIK